MLEVFRQIEPSQFRGLIKDAVGLTAICVLIVAGLGLPSIT